MNPQLQQTFRVHYARGPDSALAYCNNLVQHVLKQRDEVHRTAISLQNQVNLITNERDAAREQCTTTNFRSAIIEEDLKNTRQENQWLKTRVTELEGQDQQQLAAEVEHLKKQSAEYKGYVLHSRTEAHKWHKHAQEFYQQNLALRQQLQQVQQRLFSNTNTAATQLSAAPQQGQPWPLSNNNVVANQKFATPLQTGYMQPAMMHQTTMQQPMYQTNNPPQLAGQKRKFSDAATDCIDLTNANDEAADVVAPAAAAASAPATPVVTVAGEEGLPVQTEVVFIDDGDDDNNGPPTAATATTDAATASSTGETPTSTPSASAASPADQAHGAKRRKLAAWAVSGTNPALCHAMGTWTAEEALEADQQRVWQAQAAEMREREERMEAKLRERERKEGEEKERREKEKERKKEENRRIREERERVGKEEREIRETRVAEEERLRKEKEEQEPSAEEVADFEGLLGSDGEEDAAGEPDEVVAGEPEEWVVESLAEGEDVFGDEESEEE